MTETLELLFLAGLGILALSIGALVGFAIIWHTAAIVGTLVVAAIAALVMVGAATRARWGDE